MIYRFRSIQHDALIRLPTATGEVDACEICLRPLRTGSFCMCCQSWRRSLSAQALGGEGARVERGFGVRRRYRHALPCIRLGHILVVRDLDRAYRTAIIRYISLSFLCVRASAGVVAVLIGALAICSSLVSFAGTKARPYWMILPRCRPAMFGIHRGHSHPNVMDRDGAMRHDKGASTPMRCCGSRSFVDIAGIIDRDRRQTSTNKLISFFGASDLGEVIRR